MRFPQWVFLYLIFLLTSSAVSAKQPPPAAGPTPNYGFPRSETVTLNNGLRVTFVPFGSAPKCLFRFVTPAGFGSEQPRNGVSEVAFRLLRDGNPRTADAVARLGGELTTAVGPDAAFLQLEVLSQFAGQGLELLGETIQGFNASPSQVNSAIDDLVNKTQLQQADPNVQGDEALFKRVFPKSSSSQLTASTEQLKTISSPDIEDFMERGLQASTAHLYIVGQFDRHELETKLTSAFSELPAGRVADHTQTVKTASRGFTFVERLNAPQTSLRIGIEVANPEDQDFVGLEAVNALLGGSTMSRIRKNIREEKGYTYSPWSSLASRGGRTVWFQEASLNAPDTAAAVREVVSEIERLRAEPPSKAELDGVKTYLYGTFLRNSFSRNGIAEKLGYLETHHLPPDTYTNYKSKLDALTPEEVTKLAQKYLDPSKMSLVLVGDPSVLSQFQAMPELSDLLRITE